ncbi:MAG TPA: response regulator [Roseiflexaceae bacterium]|nr:response regulator [Roseiflexaceae bacterium]HMP42532.1 response regulator [Roseiflexaceae bacterium]
MDTNPTIYVAEDYAPIRQLIERVLVDAGYHVVLANDGAALLTLIAHELPDLVVTDLSMPTLDGLMAIQRLRADPRTQTLPILAMSGCAQSGARALALGASGFLRKPFQLDDLLDRVAQYCTRTRILGQ